MNASEDALKPVVGWVFAEGTSHRLQLLPSSGVQQIFLFLCDTVRLLPTGNFKGGNSSVSQAPKSSLILMGAPIQQGSMQEAGTQHRKFGSPFIPSHLELPTLKQDVFMFPGRMFHHLYSNPRAGSVPAGQALHSKGQRAQKISHSQGTCQTLF